MTPFERALADVLRRRYGGVWTPDDPEPVNGTSTLTGPTGLLDADALDHGSDQLSPIDHAELVPQS